MADSIEYIHTCMFMGYEFMMPVTLLSDVFLSSYYI